MKPFISCPVFSFGNLKRHSAVDFSGQRRWLKFEVQKPIMKSNLCVLICLLWMSHGQLWSQNRILVFQSDFGEKDGAVAAMKGVAVSVAPDLRIFDLTHEIPAYNIWEAAYRLNQTAAYWPAGTVFVSIVDPGVGSSRRSVVMKSRSGHYFVTPDNGSLTLISESLGVEEVREIDETKNRLPHSGESYTFHGRDVYAYTGARLAAGVISFADVGKLIQGSIVRINYQKPQLSDGKIKGTIDVLDVQYGNLWTNIPQSMLDKAGISYGDKVEVEIYEKQRLAYEGRVVFEKTFSAVPEGDPVAYLNSLMNFSLALNMGSFAEKFRIASGPEWSVVLGKAK
jgi:S-adenosylmethionine hydrolase